HPLEQLDQAVQKLSDQPYPSVAAKASAAGETEPAAKPVSSTEKEWNAKLLAGAWEGAKAQYADELTGIRKIASDKVKELLRDQETRSERAIEEYSKVYSLKY